jgi:hypothetical protein
VVFGSTWRDEMPRRVVGYSRFPGSLTQPWLRLNAYGGGGWSRRPGLNALVLASLHVDRRRDRNVLTMWERQLVDEYRSMDVSAKQMIRTLFERLAATSEPADEVTR